MSNHFENLKRLVQVAYRNLRPGSYRTGSYRTVESVTIQIIQTIGENIQSSGEVIIEKPHQQAEVDVEEYITKTKLRAREKLLCEVEEKIQEHFALLKVQNRPINLLKVNRPDLVRREVLLMPQRELDIAPDTKIIDIFKKKEIRGRLLIVGEAGSGKTITQIELAEALINEAKQDNNKPVPVFFKISSWENKKQLIFDWLVTELNVNHQIDVGIGQRLINEGQIIPLLDELDELSSKSLKLCLEEINRFLEGGSRLVVCCRLQDYKLSEYQLNLNGAICLQPLTESQIRKYIEEINQDDFHDFHAYISSNHAIKKIAKIPLFFGLIIFAYPDFKNLNIQPIQFIENQDNIFDFLFDKYMKCRISFKGGYKNYSETRIQQLSWLAKMMQRNYLTEFCVEQLQPTWLLNKAQKGMYLIGVTLIFVAIFILIFLQIGKGVYQLAMGTFLGLVFGIGLGIRGGLSERIEITESFIQQGVRYNGSGGLVFGTLGGILGCLVDWLYDGFIDGATVTLTGLFIGGLIGGIITSDIAEVTDKQIPNQGIWDSAINSIVFFLVYGFVGALIFGSICWGINGLNDALDCAQVGGISFGLCAGMVHGGNTCIQHLVLRLVLYRNNLIPWDINQFLEQSSSLRFLQKVGSQYRFIHSQFRDYLGKQNIYR